MIDTDIRYFPKPPAWVSEALCARTGHDLNFFPKYAADDISDVIEFCGHCPVRAMCLEYAVSNGETEGIWAGRDFTVRAASTAKKVAS